MKLTLSTASPLNAIYTTKDGQVRFKVEAKTTSKSTRISKTSRLIAGCEGEYGLAVAGDVSMERYLTHNADIEHSTFSPSVLRFGGEEFDIRKHFRKERWGAYGR